MAYAAALMLGLALLWLGWAPEAFEPAWLAAGGVAIVVALISALSMRIVDREGAPYLRAPLLIALGLGAVRSSFAMVMDTAKRAFASDPHLHPGLVRYRTQPSSETARAAFANAAALAIGAITVEVQDDSLLVHVLIEDDADDAELRALETRAGRAAS